jgi:hypothetical protein
MHLPAGGGASVVLLAKPRVPGGELKLPPEDTTTTDLGHRSWDSLDPIRKDLVGKRVITTIPVGKIGNEQPIQVISESWVSPELKLTVRESDDDPRTGKRTMETTHIVREEPAADLFEAPAGYTLKERSDLLNSPIARASSPVPDVETQQIAEARKDPGPVLKNDVAYKLAMEKIDLPEAQELADQAVQIAEQHTADLDPKSAEVFSQMDTLSRYWNTLGWFYRILGR